MSERIVNLSRNDPKRWWSGALGEYQRTVGERRRFIRAQRMAAVEDRDRRRAALRKEVERQRSLRKVADAIVQDFLACQNQRDMSKFFGLSYVVMKEIIDARTTPEQRHRVWCWHQNRRSKKSAAKKKLQMV